MAETTKAVITRTVTVGDLTPAEMASIFGQYDAVQQAAFFDAVAAEALSWPVAGWAMQALYIAERLTPPGRRVVTDLADCLAQ